MTFLTLGGLDNINWVIQNYSLYCTHFSRYVGLVDLTTVNTGITLHYLRRKTNRWVDLNGLVSLLIATIHGHLDNANTTIIKIKK